jgi:hypothetical protein
MCLACEQDGLWLAYLQRRGLITPDGFLVEEPPFLAGPVEPTSVAQETQEESASVPTNKSKFSCDDPSAG